MSAAAPECRQARLHIGADPHHLPVDIAAHVKAAPRAVASATRLCRSTAVCTPHSTCR